MEYAILQSRSLSGIMRDVKEALRQGWKPQGGVCKSDGIFYQAMLR